MLLDPAQTTPTSLGDPGGGLGSEGLAGVAVTFVTDQHPGYPSDNFVGVATDGSGGTLTFAGTSTNIPALRTGTHAVEVTTGPTGHLVGVPLRHQHVRVRGGGQPRDGHRDPGRRLVLRPVGVGGVEPDPVHHGRLGGTGGRLLPVSSLT